MPSLVEKREVEVCGLRADLLTPEAVEKNWEFFYEHLHPLLDRRANGEMDTADILKSIKEHKHQIWTGSSREDIKVFIVTHIVFYPGVKRIVIDFLWGTDFESFREGLDYIEHWAYQRFGCTETEAWCRPGLAKLLTRDQGFRRAYDVCIRPINRGRH